MFSNNLSDEAGPFFAEMKMVAINANTRGQMSPEVNVLHAVFIANVGGDGIGVLTEFEKI